MNDSWNDIKLGDVIKLQRGFDITVSEQKVGNIPVVSSSGVHSYHNEAKCKGPGVIIGRKGTLGTAHYIEQDYWPHDTTLWVCDFKGNHPKFIYYYLKTLKLESFDSGSSNPTLNRNHLHRLKTLFPESLIEQRRIASILSTYDELIEANNKRIALLEGMAEQIYKEWFVRMRFPGYEDAEFEKGFPKGWAIEKVETLVNRKRFGKTYSQDNVYSTGKVIVIDQSRDEVLGFHNNDADHVASIENPIIVFGDHTCKMQMIVEPFSLGENVIPLKNADDVNIHFLYYVMNSLVETTEYKRHWNELVTKKVFVSSPELQKRFGQVMEPMMALKNKLWHSTLILRQTRDLLLPRLISGKLKLKEPQTLRPETV